MLWLGSLSLLLSCNSFSYILEIKPLSAASFANLFSQSVVCLFVLSMVSFAVQKYISLMTTYFFIAFPHLFVFCFITYIIFKGCTIIQKKKRRGKQPVESHRILLQNALALKLWRRNKQMRPKQTCRVMSWPNFNTAVSLGLRKPEERQRDERRAGQWKSQNIDNIYQLSLPPERALETITGLWATEIFLLSMCEQKKGKSPWWIALHDLGVS